MTKKLFIENDTEIDRDHLETMELLMDKRFVFDEVITSAFSNSKEVFDAIIRADEIYCETAFIGESAQLLDALVYHCLKNNIKGKKLFVFRELDTLRLWNLHRPEAFVELFTTNEFYCLNKDNEYNYCFERVDINDLDI